MSDETRRKTLEQFNEMRETSESKNWLIEDLIARAEEELARDQEAEDERNQKERARHAEVERLRLQEEQEAKEERVRHQAEQEKIREMEEKNRQLVIAAALEIGQ